MVDVRILNRVLSSRHLLTIRANTSSKKILRKIFKSKKIDVIWIQKPNPQQMTAVLVARLLGKKFFWVQSFSNPPIPGLYTKVLLNQTDTIVLKSQKLAAKLRGLGIDKPKIKISKEE